MSRYIDRSSPKSMQHQHVGLDEWKLDVGGECNRLLELADYLDSIIPEAARKQGHHVATAQDIRRIVQRVADFENLEKEDE